MLKILYVYSLFCCSCFAQLLLVDSECLGEKLFPALCIDEKTQFPGQQPHLYRHGVVLLIVDVVEAADILWGERRWH